MTSSDKDFKELERLACRQGWTVETSGGNHLRWTSPSGDAVTTSASPSDRNAIRQAKRDLAKLGLITSASELRAAEKELKTPVINAEFLALPEGVPEFDFTIDLKEGDDVEALEKAMDSFRQQMADDPDYAKTFYMLPDSQKEMYVRMAASGVRPSQMPKVCDCGREFPNPFGMALHMKKCDDYQRAATEREAQRLEITSPLSIEPEPTEIELPAAADRGTIPDDPPQPDPIKEPQVALASVPDSNETPFMCTETGCGEEFATQRGRNRHVTMSHKTHAIRLRDGEPPSEEDLDALLQLVTGGAAIPMSMAALAVVNKWLDATKELLALVQDA